MWRTASFDHGSAGASPYRLILGPAPGGAGFFRAFDYSSDALREIARFFKADHAVIIPLTVREILDDQIARKLA